METSFNSAINHQNTSESEISRNSSDNKTSDNPEDSVWPTTSAYVISFCYGITSVLGIIGNGVILVAFIVERRLLRNNFNLLILNLTISDLCVAALDLPFQVVANQLGYWPFHAVECALLVFCDWGMTFVSIFTLVAISIDRYWAACWSQSYRIYNTRKRTLICIALIWVLLMITWTPAYLVDRIRIGDELQVYCDFSLSDNREFALYVMVAGYHVPSFLMIFCYFKVYLAVRKTRKVFPLPTVFIVTPSSTTHSKPLTERTRCPIASNSGLSAALDHRALGKWPEAAESSRREMKVFRSLSYIIIAYLVLWTPCHFVVDVLCFDQSLVADDLYSYVCVLCYFNSALNPVLYAASNDQTRNALRRIFFCGKRKV